MEKLNGIDSFDTEKEQQKYNLHNSVDGRTLCVYVCETYTRKKQQVQMYHNFDVLSEDANTSWVWNMKTINGPTVTNIILLQSNVAEIDGPIREWTVPVQD